METGVKLPLGKKVSILKSHPCGLVALEKPVGLMTTPNDSEDYGSSLLNAKFDKKKEAYVWMDAEQQKQHFYIGHRLDSPTSGIILGSTDSAVANALREAFRLKQVTKTYLAAVNGSPRGKKGVWKDQLQTQQKSQGVRTRIGNRAGDDAQTNWEFKARSRSQPFSLLKLMPISGKTHQLRVQSSHRGMPILGDRTYGDFKLNNRIKKELGIKRLMLHAWKIEVILTWDGNRCGFVAETSVPDSFRQLFDI
jgi:tRNA pseudouridine65 synthase